MDFLDNRELSWLKFNKRVIEEAVDEKVPLLERLTFSSIYQSNMDEFFMVRVGSITDEGLVDKDKRENKTNMTSAQQLDAIFTAVRRLQPIAEDAYIKTMSELKPFGFEHVSFDTATEEEKKFLELYFKREIKPLIAPIIIDKQHPFPFLKNKELYVTVQLFSKKNVKVGIIPVKHEHFERLIPLDNTGKRFIPAEEVILQFADLVFKNFKVIDKTIMRVTRNADLDFSHASEDFREFMTEAIKKRKKLAPVRLELSGEFSRAALDYICKKLDLKNERVFYSRIPLDLSYLFSLHELSSESCLKYNKREPQKPSCIADNRSIFSQVKSKDILLSYPYESIEPFIRLLRESAADPKVTSIKITLYRLARNSKVIDALCSAAENGKDVFVMIELRARFDEENNIEWSKILQNAGCHVIYGPDGFKAHSKLLLITRKTMSGFEYVTQIGTGNYNEKTATLYSDLTLMTADAEIAEDAENVFDALLTGTFVESTKKLLVAPLCLQNKLLEMADEEIEHAKNGEPAYIAAKVNSLTDKKIINKLVEASCFGVKIELVVRGICCIIPGVPGITENITVRSIVGRFLEHSRIYIFGTDERRKMYISSADYMTRNTVKRVEVAAPVLDERLKKRINCMFDIMLKDNVKARIMKNDAVYAKQPIPENAAEINSQEYFYDEAYKNAAAKKERQVRAKLKKAEKSKKTPIKKKNSGK